MHDANTAIRRSDRLLTAAINLDPSKAGSKSFPSLALHEDTLMPPQPSLPELIHINDLLTVLVRSFLQSPHLAY